MSKQKPTNQPTEKKLSNKERDREIKRQRTIAKDSIYPILLKYAKNVEDAQSMCGALNMAIQQSFNKTVNEYQVYLSGDTLSVLKIDDQMKKSKEFMRDRELLEVLKNEKISVASSLLGGLQAAIASWIKKENLERKLETLPTDFL